MNQSQENPWEAAYLRFETPEQEIRKFTKRLLRAGAGTWPRDWQIAELFCGRGGGLHSLSRMGFTNLHGVDLSPTLIGQYAGPARCHIGDCRELPFESGSLNAVIIQGGLHHLTSLPQDLVLTLSEARRVLRTDGKIVIVEPWMTPFLAWVHRISRTRAARRVSIRVDALATMIEHERITYEQWLAQPEMILAQLASQFDADKQEISRGKLLFVGRPRRG